MTVLSSSSTAARSGMAAPHWRQKRAVALLSVPHLRQRGMVVLGSLVGFWG